MKYLVTGDKGQLGKEFMRYLQMNGMESRGVDIDDINIGDIKAVRELVDEEKPDIIINCAAYNYVDDAEKDPVAALRTNAAGIANLAEVSENHKSYIIHFSSDYVFDGEKKDSLYIESDIPNPINQYGLSKLRGDEILKEIAPDRHLIMRLSWVYGSGRQNFIYKLSQWAEKNRSLNIAFDEVSVPTYTKTITTVTMKAIKRGLIGLYHLAATGYASRYEWAKLALRLMEKDVLLYPVSRSSFGLPAKRPYFTAMSNNKISRELDINIPDWENDLKAFLK